MQQSRHISLEQNPCLIFEQNPCLMGMPSQQGKKNWGLMYYTIKVWEMASQATPQGRHSICLEVGFELAI
jgi:hypothetical protein